MLYSMISFSMPILCFQCILPMCYDYFNFRLFRGIRGWDTTRGIATSLPFPMEKNDGMSSNLVIRFAVFVRASLVRKSLQRYTNWT